MVLSRMTDFVSSLRGVFVESCHDFEFVIFLVLGVQAVAEFSSGVIVESECPSK
jgi:hypothetical protein